MTKPFASGIQWPGGHCSDAKGFGSLNLRLRHLEVNHRLVCAIRALKHQRPDADRHIFGIHWKPANAAGIADIIRAARAIDAAIGCVQPETNRFIRREAKYIDLDSLALLD